MFVAVTILCVLLSGIVGMGGTIPHGYGNDPDGSLAGGGGIEGSPPFLPIAASARARCRPARRRSTSRPMPAAFPTAATPAGRPSHVVGLLLILAAALLWSTGALFVRSIEAADSPTIVFWRSISACAFILVYLLARHRSGTLDLFCQLGPPGLAVALCTATGSASLVIALNLPSVAHVLVIMSTAPLFASLLAWAMLGERPARTTMLAILASVVGMALMVSESLAQGGLAGDLVALIIAVAMSVALVLIRQNSHIRMAPAMCLATLIAALAMLPFANPWEVSDRDLALLVLFGAGQLGLGLALYSYGASLVPVAQTALLGLLEPILGPLWVWLLRGEQPSPMALLGGGIVIAALLLVTAGRNRA